MSHVSHTKETVGEAAHHKFQRQVLATTWKDRVRNEAIRAQTKLEKLDIIIKKIRLRWFGHLAHGLAKQAAYWETKTVKRKLGR